MDGTDQRIRRLEFTVVTTLDPGEIRRAGQLAAALEKQGLVVESSVGTEGVVYAVGAGRPASAIVLVLHWVRQGAGSWRVTLGVEDVGSGATSSASDHRPATHAVAARSFAAELHRRLTHG